MTEALHIDCILVPIDGSACSRDAAVQAVRIAKSYSARVCFVHAIDENVVEAVALRQHDEQRDELRERLRTKGEAYLRDAARLATKEGVPYQQESVAGDPCAVICEQARKRRAQLIVMGRIGHRGTRRLLGSVTRRVIECSDVPVLVVTGPVAPAAASRGQS